MADVRLIAGQRGDESCQDRPHHRRTLPRSGWASRADRASPGGVRPDPSPGAAGDRAQSPAGEQDGVVPGGGPAQPLRGRALPPAAACSGGTARRRGRLLVRTGSAAPRTVAAAVGQRCGRRTPEHRLRFPTRQGPHARGRRWGLRVSRWGLAAPCRTGACGSSGHKGFPQRFRYCCNGSMVTEDKPVPRPLLDVAALESALVRPGGMWSRIEVVPEVGSTNTELVVRAQQGAPHGTVLVTEHQTAGRGRLGRGFSTPPRAALTFSLLVRPNVPTERLSWLSGLMGVAAVGAVRRVSGAKVALKWSNDLLVPAELRAGTNHVDGKVAGILAEVDLSSEEGPGAIVGMGVNVSQNRLELPVDSATSLLEESADVDR